MTVLPVRKALFCFLVGLALVLTVGFAMGVASRIDEQRWVRQGAFELAFTSEAAAKLLDDWGSGAREHLRAVIYWDFAFIPGYVAVLAGLISLIHHRRPNARLARWTGPLILGVVAAGVLDGIENVAMLAQLGDTPSVRAPLVAGVCASIKWLLVAVAGAYILYAAIGSRWARHRS